MVKNPPSKAGDTRDTGSIPELERSPREGNGNPLQYSCPESPIDRGAWQCVFVVAGGRSVCFSPWGRTESDTAEATESRHTKHIASMLEKLLSKENYFIIFCSVNNHTWFIFCDNLGLYEFKLKIIANIYQRPTLCQALCQKVIEYCI